MLQHKAVLTRAVIGNHKGRVSLAPARVHLEPVGTRAAGGAVAPAQDQPVIARPAKKLVGAVRGTHSSRSPTLDEKARDQIIAQTTGQDVGPAATRKLVIARLTGQAVIAEVAKDVVIALFAPQEIIAILAMQRVVAHPGQNNVISCSHSRLIVARAKICVIGG